MVDTSWTIHTAGTNLTADYGTGDWHTLTRGDEATFQFGLSTSEWASFQQYADYAGAFVLHRGVDGDVRYTSRLPTSADVDSLLLGIEPNSDLKNRDVTGVWGVVDSGSDERDNALANYEYAIDLTVLAEFAKYADHASALSALEESL